MTYHTASELENMDTYAILGAINLEISFACRVAAALERKGDTAAAIEYLNQATDWANHHALIQRDWLDTEENQAFAH